MANEILIKSLTPVVFANSGDYSNVGSGYTRTAQINLTSLAQNAARQSDKVNLDDPRAPTYAVHMGVEFSSAPTAGRLVEVYWSASASATAGTGNDGGASGADGAYKASEEDEWKRQLTPVGSLLTTADGAGTVQRMLINRAFCPQLQYGSIVIVNKTDQDLDSDAIQMYVAFVPVPDELQDAP